MAEHKAILQRMIHTVTKNADQLGLKSILELLDDHQVLIENHGGVLEYGREKIRIRVKTGCLCILGEQLHLCCLSPYQLVIRGSVTAIHIIRRKGI